MKFLKKLALVNITPSGTIFHYHSPGFAYTNTNVFLSFCLCNFEKLANLLNRHLLIRKKTDLLKQRFNHPNQKIINAATAIPVSSSDISWARLIKTASSAKNCSIRNQTHSGSHHHLAGRSVLCVGGRIKLYPEYNQFIENYGGHLMTFHGDHNDQLDNLPQLLEKADMIICPIDCVNHQAFFIVKYYCQYSGKLCVLLDRSEVNTFCRGINMLVTLTTEEVSISKIKL